MLQAVSSVLIFALSIAAIMHSNSLLPAVEGREVIVALTNIVIGVLAIVIALRLLVLAVTRSRKLRPTHQRSRHLLLLAMLGVGVVVFVVAWAQPTPQVSLGMALAAIAVALTSLVVGEENQRPERHLQDTHHNPGA